MKAEAGNCGPAKRQKWKDKVKKKGFTIRPLTQRKNTSFIWAGRCRPGDWRVTAFTALARDMKTHGRDGSSFLELLSNEGSESPKGK